MYKRPSSFPIVRMTFAFTIHTTIYMSRPTTPTVTLDSTSDSPRYIPSSPTIELEDTFIAWTPQLAIRSAGPIQSPTNNQRLLAEIWGLVASRIAAARNIFSTTIQHARRSFGPELEAKAYGLVHFHEPLPEFPASETRGEIIVVREPSPIVTEVPPPYSNGSTLPPLLTPNTPSPDPIPIPPRLTEERLVDSPNPLDTETAVASPTPSVMEIPNPEPVDPNHPGEGWQPNICREGIAYPMQILEEDGAVTIAPYLRLDLNRGDPHIEVTLGLGQSITSRPLHATPDRYPRIMLTERQLQYFKAGEAQTALANRALRDEQDISLQAEVYRYREGVRRTERLAKRVWDARQEYQAQRRLTWNSARRLADANAWARLGPRDRQGRVIPWDGPVQTTPNREMCLWCEDPGHATHFCTNIRICLLCGTGRHSERKCRQPHALCEDDRPCRVARDHYNYQPTRFCRSRIRMYEPYE